MIVKRALLVLAAIAALPVAAAPRATALERLQAIAAAYDRHDCKPALTDGAALVDSPGRGGLSPDLVTAAYALVVACAAQEGEVAKAHAYAVAATDADLGGDELWEVRLASELEAKTFDAAVTTLEAMRHGHGAALNAIDPHLITFINTALYDGSHPALYERFLKVVAEAYASDQPFVSTDYYRFRYAALLQGHGDAVAASALVHAIDDPSILEILAVDPRFRAALPPGFDLRQAFDRQLAADRATAAAHPDILNGAITIAGDLWRLGRPQEALDVLDQVKPDLDKPGRFSDLEDRLPWWWNARADSLALLGRYDEMLASFEAGARLSEHGTPNVSQTINLAAAQNRFGRADAALRTIAAFDDGKHDSSAYGEMLVRFQRGCANSMPGRAKQAADELDFMRAHEKDHPDALGDLLICMGDLDGAAAAFIRRLDDPDRRPAALLRLSDYDPPPASAPRDPVTARLPELKARADVAAAIARAGGTRRFPVQQGDF